ncbi:LamG domain-containing protein, partial [Akkermansiaceae bacterium]|nr:LamG domain-containing protein [Akkermansiaceae bacterium]
FDANTDTKSIWIDGALAATETAPNQYSPNGTVEFESLHIGAGQDDGLNFYFSGNIDDVTIWNEALDAAAIQNIRDNGISVIPEATSLGLLALGCLGLVRRRRS